VGWRVSLGISLGQALGRQSAQLLEDEAQQLLRGARVALLDHG
jgi:hypothetical protein